MSSPGMSLLVSVEELAAHPEWRIFDCRHDLKNTDYGRQAYARGHIPGALFLHLDEDLSGATTGGNGRHPLPAIDAFARRMSDCGVDASTQVVAYDNEGGIFAARLWWLLRWLGHRAGAVLDGGLPAWRQARLPLTAELPAAQPIRFDAKPDDRQWLTAEQVLALSAEEVLLDARGAARAATLHGNGRALRES